jgi:hypothetical protein
VSGAKNPVHEALLLVDAAGTRLALEYDTRDGRTFLTITFDGREAPFELTHADAGALVTRLGAFSGPAFIAALRFTSAPPEAVKRGPGPVKTGKAGS